MKERKKEYHSTANYGIKDYNLQSLPKEVDALLFQSKVQNIYENATKVIDME